MGSSAPSTALPSAKWQLKAALVCFLSSSVAGQCVFNTFPPISVPCCSAVSNICGSKCVAHLQTLAQIQAASNEASLFGFRRSLSRSLQSDGNCNPACCDGLQCVKDGDRDLEYCAPKSAPDPLPPPTPPPATTPPVPPPAPPPSLPPSPTPTPSTSTPPAPKAPAPAPSTSSSPVPSPSDDSGSTSTPPSSFSPESSSTEAPPPTRVVAQEASAAAGLMLVMKASAVATLAAFLMVAMV